MEKSTEKPNVVIYTDGGCNVHHEEKPGGWGVLLLYGEHEKELSGNEFDTTNNRMELTAVVRGLNALKKPCMVTLYIDSTYVKRGITEWIKGWVRNGWRTANKKPVKNKDLWEDLLKATERHEINWEWVKGHDGNEGNERVDVLAVEARKRLE